MKSNSLGIGFGGNFKAGRLVVPLLGASLVFGLALGCSSGDEPAGIIHAGGTSAGGSGVIPAGGTAAGTAPSSGGTEAIAGTGTVAGSSSGGVATGGGGAGGISSVAGTTGGGSGGAAGAGGAPSTSICTPSGAKFDCNNVIVGFDGYANVDNAQGPSQGSDASQINCTPSDSPGQQKIFKEKHWQLKGPGITAGAMYKVKVHFYGIVECKTYVGGTGPSKTDPNESANVSQTHDLWLNGAKDNGDHWNTYAFTVTAASNSNLIGIGDQTGPFPAAADTYLINQCPGNKAEGHFTWNIDFEETMNVPGESFINYIEYDTNCRMIANCGAADAAQSCDGPYNIVSTVTQAVPGTNAMFMQPIANTANPPSRGQWWLADVISVTAM